MAPPVELDPDLLEALLANEPEYSWEDQASAPIPPMVTPAAFRRTQTKPSIYAHGSASGSTSSLSLSRRDSDQGVSAGGGRQPRKSALKGSVSANHNLDTNWTVDTFPFNYDLPQPPSLLTPLFVLKASDPLPLSSVCFSPYLRIPPYTFCARTSLNWRISNAASLRSRCHLTFLPYFDEAHFEDEDEFRERVNDSRTKIVFHIPNEEEKDEELPPPAKSMCGICLSVGCIVHHRAEAMPLPTLGGDEESGPSKSLLLPSQAASTSSLNLSVGSGGGNAPSANRFARRRPRDRASQACGSDCIVSVKAVNDNEVEHEAYETWTEEEKTRFEEILTSLSFVTSRSTGGDGENSVAAGLSSCTVAGYMMTRTCIDVEFALRARRKDDSPEIQFTGLGETSFSSSTSGHHRAENSREEPRDKSHRENKKRKMVHEKERQRDIAPHYQNRPTDESGEYSKEELKMRVPRAVLPWVPCYHPGRPCTSFTGTEDPYSSTEFCACRRNGTWCEPGCGCPVDCPERFSGCQCAATGNGQCRSTFEDARGNSVQGCNCADHYRECHPEICAGHDENKCKFMSMQDDRAIRTFVAASDLEGYGLFVGEDSGSSTRLYIGEYKGELVNENEAQERSLLYQVRQRSFLFDLTKLGVVDGIRLGNKTRYINTARNKKNNCRGDSTQINGEARLLIHASKDTRHKLQKNDELLLDYGGNFELFGPAE